MYVWYAGAYAPAYQTVSDKNQMSHWYNNSPDDVHMAARNKWRIEINIQEKIVRQFGYLQGTRLIFEDLWNTIQYNTIQYNNPQTTQLSVQ